MTPADIPMVSDLAQPYLVEHVEVRCEPRTIASGRWLVQKFVSPELGELPIDEVERKHIAALHYRHRDTPYQANRILEVVGRCSISRKPGASVPTTGTLAASYRSTGRSGRGSS